MLIGYAFEEKGLSVKCIQFRGTSQKSRSSSKSLKAIHVLSDVGTICNFSAMRLFNEPSSIEAEMFGQSQTTMFLNSSQ